MFKEKFLLRRQFQLESLILLVLRTLLEGYPKMLVHEREEGVSFTSPDILVKRRI